MLLKIPESHDPILNTESLSFNEWSRKAHDLFYAPDRSVALMISLGEDSYQVLPSVVLQQQAAYEKLIEIVKTLRDREQSEETRGHLKSFLRLLRFAYGLRLEYVSGKLMIYFARLGPLGTVAELDAAVESSCVAEVKDGNEVFRDQFTTYRDLLKDTDLDFQFASASEQPRDKSVDRDVIKENFRAYDELVNAAMEQDVSVRKDEKITQHLVDFQELVKAMSKIEHGKTERYTLRLKAHVLWQCVQYMLARYDKKPRCRNDESPMVGDWKDDNSDYDTPTPGNSQGGKRLMLEMADDEDRRLSSDSELEADEEFDQED